MNGALVAGSIDAVPGTVLRASKTKAARLSVRASLKDERRDSLAVVAPAVVLLADAGAANALTAEDVTGTFLKVRKLPVFFFSFQFGA